MKRAVYDAIGGLDERFGLGFFDDDDLAERARRAGFELAVAHDLFVHHFGSRTFVGNGIDAEKLLDENARRFAAKWGLPGTSGRRVALQPCSSRTDVAAEPCGTNRAAGQPRIAPRTAIDADLQTREPEHEPVGQPAISRDRSPCPRRSIRAIRAPIASRRASTVSLTMIVRNEQDNLAALPRVGGGLFDEIVVVDTGSTDRTDRDRPLVRGEGVRLRLGRRLRRGPERGAGAGDRRLRLLARCRRRG